MAARQLACAGLLAVLLSGCTTTPKNYLTSPGFGSRYGEVARTGVMPPDVAAYSLTAGGMREKNDEWTLQMEQNFADYLRNMRWKAGNPVIISRETLEDDAVLREVNELAYMVSITMMQRLMPMAAFKPASEPQFSVGDCSELFDKLGVDALLLVDAEDEVSTGGRHAMQALGILLGAATGVAIVPRGGGSFVDCMLVDRSGDVMYYTFRTSASTDFRTPEDVNTVMDAIMADLHASGRAGK